MALVSSSSSADNQRKYETGETDTQSSGINLSLNLVPDYFSPQKASFSHARSLSDSSLAGRVSRSDSPLQVQPILSRPESPTFSKDQLKLVKHDINTLKKEELEAIASIVDHVDYAMKNQGTISQEELRAYTDFKINFESTYKQCLNKALTLHQDFKEAFGEGYHVEYEESHRVVKAPYEQYLVAKYLALKHFRGLMSLAKTDKQAAQVAHLIQMIMVGYSNGDDILKPDSSQSFCIREFQSRRLDEDDLRTGLIFGVEREKFRLSITQGAKKESQAVAESFARFKGQVIDNTNVEVFILTDQGLVKLKGLDQQISLEEFIDKLNMHKQIPDADDMLTGETKIGSPNISFVMTNSDEEPLFDDKNIEILLSEIPEEDRIALTTKFKSEDVDESFQTSLLEFMAELPTFGQYSEREYVEKVFGKYHVQLEGERHPREPIDITPKKQTLILDQNGRCLDISVEHSLYLPSHIAAASSFAEDTGGTTPIATVTVPVGDKDGTASYSDLQNNHFFRRLLWDWRCPEHVEAFFANDVIKLKDSTLSFTKILFYLEQLRKVAGSEFGDKVSLQDDLRVEVQGANSATAWASWLFGKSEPDRSQQSLDLLGKLTEKLRACIEREKHVIRLVSPRAETDLKEFDVYLYRELNSIKTKIIKNPNTNQKEDFVHRQILFPSTLKHIDKILSEVIDPENVPKQETSSNEKGVLERAAGAVYQSQNPVEIGWKIRKYKSMILQLRQGFKGVLSKYVSDVEAYLKILKSEEYTTQLEVQFQALALTLFDKKLETIKDDNFSQKGLTYCRETYKNSIYYLRKLLTVPEGASSTIQQICQDLCAHLYTQMSLEDESVAINKLFETHGADSLNEMPQVFGNTIEGSELARKLGMERDKHYKVPFGFKAPLLNQVANSLRGVVNVTFDPNTQANLPHVLGTVCIKSEKEKEIKLCALGSPTIEPKLSYAQGNPEFIGWMQNYKRNGKKHLYVNNQNSLKYLRPAGVEKDRINAILEIAKDPELEDTFFTILLCKDSPFYYQNFNSDQLETFADPMVFKQELIRQHFDLSMDMSGNYIPQKIHEKFPKLREECVHYIEIIHEVLFHNRRELTVRQRQIFIDIFHDILTLHLVKELDVDSFNITCKDGIDRAAESFSRLWYHLSVINNGHTEKDFLEHFYALLFTRAVMVRKRPILEERLKRVDLDFLASHPEGLIKLHKSVFQGVSISVRP